MGELDKPDNENPLSGYSPLAKGYLLGTLVLIASIEAVIPVIVGGWLDKRFHTAPLLVLLGIGLGLFIMISQLLRIVKKV